MSPKISEIANENNIYHTDVCRAHNPKGSKSHFNGCPDKIMSHTQSAFGGYHCICDFMQRIKALDNS